MKHENAVYEDRLDAYFPPARNIKKHPLEDIDFQQISHLLRFSGKADAGETPKLYYILRTIQELDRLPFLHAKGLTIYGSHSLNLRWRGVSSRILHRQEHLHKLNSTSAAHVGPKMFISISRATTMNTWTS